MLELLFCHNNILQQVHLHIRSLVGQMLHMLLTHERISKPIDCYSTVVILIFSSHRHYYYLNTAHV